MVMVTVTAVLKVLSVFVAELVSSITDWFQTKPTWAKLEVLEDTELKTTGGSELETCLKTITLNCNFFKIGNSVLANTTNEHLRPK